MIPTLLALGALAGAILSVTIYSSPARRDVETIKADVDDVGSQVTTFDNLLNSYSDTIPDLQAALVSL